MTDPVPALVAQAQAALVAAANPDDAGPMQAYMKTDMPFLGVKAGPRREATRTVVRAPLPDRETYERLVLGLWALPHREGHYVALDLAMRHARYITLDSLPLYERLVREGQWWDLVDGVASNLVGAVLLKQRAALAPLMERWVEDPDLWIRRTAILSQLRHKSRTDADMLFRFCLARAHEREFFMTKAIGWALREYAKAEPAAVLAFLDAHHAALAPLSLREASKHLDWSRP